MLGEVGEKSVNRMEARSDKDSDNSACATSSDSNDDSAGSSDEVAQRNFRQLYEPPPNDVNATAYDCSQNPGFTWKMVLSCGLCDNEEYRTASLVDELEKKYLCNVDIDESIILLKSMTGTSPCKLASEHTLLLLVLNHKYIDRIGDKVDLAWNKLSSWEEIIAIFSLPRLEVLNLGYNPLQSFLTVPSFPLAMNLELFILNGTDLPMSTVRRLLNKMPKLKELHLSENRNLKNRFDVSDEVMSISLESLHVSKCDIEYWETVISLWRFFPNLVSLSLCENPIRYTSCKMKVVVSSFFRSCVVKIL
ncbi:unnamed protein product [Onchocerca flexuosa]|uniref:Leucine Rich repeat-containing domain protein n=1 Tax=Onchocerca flexuosa TaxID=387005 RepID=A0A183H4R9_9BILA|nr:unnamed protein product [Onchocerca flexuosa]